MRRRDTKANLTTESLISLILAVGFIILMIILIVAFLKPGYNENKEYAKAQLKQIETILKNLDDGESQEHIIISVPQDSKHFLVYFDNVNSIKNYYVGTYATMFYETEDLGWKAIKFQFNIVERAKLAKELVWPIKADFYTPGPKEKQLCACYFTKSDIPLGISGEEIIALKTTIPAICTSCIQLDKDLKNPEKVISLQSFLFKDPAKKLTITKQMDGYTIK